LTTAEGRLIDGAGRVVVVRTVDPGATGWVTAPVEDSTTVDVVVDTRARVWWP
jgi:hypothetical protein